MISHLKARAEFYALCLEHGEEYVEWCLENQGAGRSQWVREPPNFDTLPSSGRGLEFRIRPKTVYMPEAEIPEEAPDGAYGIQINIYSDDRPHVNTRPTQWYRTAEDRDKVLAAMLARVKR